MFQLGNPVQPEFSPARVRVSRSVPTDGSHHLGPGQTLLLEKTAENNPHIGFHREADLAAGVPSLRPVRGEVRLVSLHTVELVPQLDAELGLPPNTSPFVDLSRLYL